MKKRVNISSIFWFFLLFTISAFDYSTIPLFHYSTIPPFHYSTISPAFAQPQIRLTEIVWNFGKLTEGVTAQHTITVKNPGTEELKVNLRSSCECLQVQPEKLTVLAKNSTDVKISVYTQGYPGKFGKYIYLDTNDPENPYVTLLVKGEIQGQVSGIRHPASITQRPASSIRYPVSGISVTMFGSFNCIFCREIREKILPSLEKKYEMKIHLREYSLDEPKNYEILVSLEKKLGKTENRMPVLFIGEDVLGGEKNIRKEVEALIKKYVKQGGAKEIEISPVEKEVLKKEILAKFKQFRFLPILFAGFIDGLNPCAFAAIVFFIAYLTMILKKPKKEVFLTGITFIFGVFVAYFLIGLGLARIFQKIKGITFLSQAIYFLIGLLTLILAYYSFRDYFAVKRIEKGKTEKVKLQLPQFFRWKIYEVIEKQAKLKYFVIFAFVSGVLISILEFFCTGQVYLPTIMYMVQVSAISHQPSAISYLVLYSLMFVLPLAIVFSLAYFGVSSEKIEIAGRQHVALVKLLTGLIFLFLSVAMFVIVSRSW